MMQRADDRPEMVALLEALCSERMTETQSKRLQELLRNSPGSREMYVNYMTLHAGISWRLRDLKQPATALPTVGHRDADSSPAPGFIRRMLGRTMNTGGPRIANNIPAPLSTGRLNSFATIAIMAGLFLILSLVAIVPAYLSLRRAELENAQRQQREEQERQLAASKAQEEKVAEQQAKQNSRALFAAYAKLLSEQNPLPAARAVRNSAAWVYAHGLGQARLTFAVDCRWRGAAPGAGEALSLGRRLQLKSGLAEIVFQNGARTILQGPATLQILSGSGAYLQVGRFTVNADDPRAKGFVVGTPGMKYTDLGTEFGVFVDADGEQEMHVFRGRVEAEQAESRGQGAGSKEQGAAAGSSPPAPRPLLLTAHQAIRVAAPADQGQPATPIEPIAADERQFVRALPGKYAEVVLSMRPVAYYRFQRPKDPADRLVIADSAPGGHPGKLFLGLEPYDPYIAGRFGDALRLRGMPTPDGVLVLDYPATKVNQLSISAWARAESRPEWANIAANWAATGDPHIQDGRGQFHFGCYQNEGDLALIVSDAAGNRVEVREGHGSQFPVGEWQHVAFTIDGKIARLYRNGREVASRQCNGILAEPPTHSMGVGCKPDDNGRQRPAGYTYWDGGIAEVAVFHRALSAREVQRLYEGK